MTRLTEQDAIVQAVADYNAGVTQSNNSLAGAGQIQRLVYQYMAAGVTTNPTRQTPIGRIMGYIFDNATFSPLSLFSAGEVGAWYDPSDFSSMFQDAAGTTPVTAVEQPVGKILDKSGRGNHASQATATSRPVLKVDANGKYYLYFDGVDDSLATAAINFSATDKMTVWAGVRKLADIAPGAQSIVMLSNDTSATNGTFSLMARNTYSPYYYAAESKGTTKQDAIATSASYAAPVTSVLTGLSDISGDSVKLRINGADIQTDVGDQGTGNYASNQALKIFIRDDGSNLNGNLYSLIVRGAASTAAEITSGEQYVATKSGVTL